MDIFLLPNIAVPPCLLRSEKRRAPLDAENQSNLNMLNRR